MNARRSFLAPELLRKIPPLVRAALALLESRGHTIAVRINRNGSPRYTIDGRRDIDALTLARRYKTD